MINGKGGGVENWRFILLLLFSISVIVPFASATRRRMYIVVPIKDDSGKRFVCVFETVH